MNELQIKQNIKQALQRFERGTLKNAAIYLLDTLGYRSDIGTGVEFDSPDDFLEQFDRTQKLNRDNALIEQWQSVEVLFQLTDDDIKETEQLGFIFEASSEAIDNTIIESYLFLALKLRGQAYSRTALSNITREINKLTPMPAMVLFQHGQTLTLSVINRRLHKRDDSRDVLEKVTLIKDIDFATPHRAHIEILFDLSLEQLHQNHGFTNFVELHRAWQKTLDSSELNKRFFREVANWYFWAVEQVTFPKDAGDDIEIRNATSVIRLITRLIFVWFLREKGLIPDALFNQAKLQDILNLTDIKESTYYKAILQNLFFATLNQKMNTEKEPDNRKFRSKAKQSGQRDQHYMVHNVYRYQDYFKQPDEALSLFESIPFLNGGLFECLDKREKDNPKQILRIDGFSDRYDNELVVPDFLFFADERDIDLNKTYGTRNKRYKVRGILNILDSYKFTINENTPIEEEVALDPELLGKVFENLLAAYNPETGATARKQTGSFYTPREIVNYMVDESLIAYLESKLNADDNVNERLHHLIAYNDEPHRFNEQEVERLIEAIDTIKILDPACGSGAFPMGILHKLVYILGKLDPGNERWKAKQIAKANEIPDSTIREKVVAEIEQAFERNELDYGRKLYLIENCIYGVDIQPIATQIAKLRFFISLVVDQKIDDTQENRGIIPLPNLETKFVAANTLIGIGSQLDLRTPEIAQKEKELEDVRRRHFTARTPKTKDKYRKLDAKLRAEISELLKKSGLPSETTAKLAYWDPYDQNASADFLDTEWMFGITDGFDVVIGNPPYVFARDSKKKGLSADDKEYFYKNFELAEYQVNLYPLFIEQGHQMLKEGARLCYITPNNWLTINANKKLRKFILDQSDIKIVNFYAQIFESSAVDSSIIIFKKGEGNRKITLLEYIDDFIKIKEISSDYFMNQRDYVINIELLKNSVAVDLINKIETQSIQLKIIADVKSGLKAYEVGKGVPAQTREMKEKRVYHSHTKNGDNYFKYLQGKDVCRYCLKWSGEFLKYGKNLAAPRNDFRLFSTKRIIVRQIPSKPPYCINACLIDEIVLNDLNSMNVINIKETPEFVLAVLNSKLISYWFVHKLGKMQRGTFPQFKVNELATFPIPKTFKPYREILTKKVDRIIAAKKANPNADTTELEREIDRLVYEIYGLTEEEIAIVEESVSTGTAIKGEIDINTASPAELALLDGIGNKTAELIIAGRPYRKVDDLLKVRGIGKNTLAKFRGKVMLE